MYSALRWDSPAVRRVGKGRDRTWEGEGKEGWVEGKRAVNFERMEAAAWLETCENSSVVIRRVYDIL